MSKIDISQIRFVASGLDHPEDLAFDSQGNLYAGGELGQIYKMDKEGNVQELCRTGGQSLGMNFGPDGYLYVCNQKLKAVLKVSVETGSWSVFAENAGEWKLNTPNYPVFDRDGNLYVSDSGDWKQGNGMIYRFTLDGKGEVFSEGPYQFTNGLAINPEQTLLFVVESNANRVVALPLKDHGALGQATVFVDDIYNVPDGLAFDRKGNLYVTCFASNRIYKVNQSGRKEILLEDPDGIFVAAPTNCVITGEENETLYFANLNSHFIGRIELPHE